MTTRQSGALLDDFSEGRVGSNRRQRQRGIRIAVAPGRRLSLDERIRTLRAIHRKKARKESKEEKAKNRNKGDIRQVKVFIRKANAARRSRDKAQEKVRTLREKLADSTLDYPKFAEVEEEVKAAEEHLAHKQKFVDFWAARAQNNEKLVPEEKLVSLKTSESFINKTFLA